MSNQNPLVISFPVVEVGAYSLDAKGRGIMLKMAPIAPVHLNGRTPTHCKVICMLENGKMIEITIPMKVWEDALRDPVFFIEGADVRGPTSALKGPSVTT